VIGAVPPKVKPDGVSDINLLSNPDYVRGYEKEAHRRKVGKAATGAGTGTLAGIMVALIVVLSAWN
jgi:hypothetical protein